MVVLVVGPCSGLFLNGRVGLYSYPFRGLAAPVQVLPPGPTVICCCVGLYCGLALCGGLGFGCCIGCSLCCRLGLCCGLSCIVGLSWSLFSKCVVLGRLSLSLLSYF